MQMKVPEIVNKNNNFKCQQRKKDNLQVYRRITIFCTKEQIYENNSQIN